MAKVINFPDGKEIVKKDSDTVDIIHKLGEELSLVFEKDKVILTYSAKDIGSDSFWMMVCAIVFLYSDDDGFEEMRDNVLKHSIKTGFPFRFANMDKDVNFEFDINFDDE
tara:strand:+ start:260 stop:589 length:330 start_codon:yes stop_codon:yes gene_type:complete